MLHLTLTYRSNHALNRPDFTQGAQIGDAPVYQYLHARALDTKIGHFSISRTEGCVRVFEKKTSEPRRPQMDTFIALVDFLSPSGLVPLSCVLKCMSGVWRNTGDPVTWFSINDL